MIVTGDWRQFIAPGSGIGLATGRVTVTAVNLRSKVELVCCVLNGTLAAKPAFEHLVAGAEFAGNVIAERLASQANKTVLAAWERVLDNTSSSRCVRHA